MKTCEICSSEIATELIAAYEVPSMGIPVTIYNSARQNKCACDEEIIIPDMEGLIAAAAVSRVLMPAKLAAADIVFLRKALETSSKDLAAQLEVTPETVSRWENGKIPIGPGSEKLLRLAVGVRLSEKAPGIVFKVEEVIEMRIHSVRGLCDDTPIMLTRALVVNSTHGIKQEKYTEKLAA